MALPVPPCGPPGTPGVTQLGPQMGTGGTGPSDRGAKCTGSPLNVNLAIITSSLVVVGVRTWHPWFEPGAHGGRQCQGSPLDRVRVHLHAAGHPSSLQYNAQLLSTILCTARLCHAVHPPLSSTTHRSTTHRFSPLCSTPLISTMLCTPPYAVQCAVKQTNFRKRRHPRT